MESSHSPPGHSLPRQGLPIECRFGQFAFILAVEGGKGLGGDRIGRFHFQFVAPGTRMDPQDALGIHRPGPVIDGADASDDRGIGRCILMMRQKGLHRSIETQHRLHIVERATCQKGLGTSSQRFRGRSAKQPPQAAAANNHQGAEQQTDKPARPVNG